MTSEENDRQQDEFIRIPTKIIQRMLALTQLARQEPWDLQLTDDGDWRIDFRGKFHFMSQIPQGFFLSADQADAMHIAAAQPCILGPLLMELLKLRGEEKEESKIILGPGSF